MALTIWKHPFKNGCGEIPKDKMNLINEIKAWLKTQTDLPELSGEFFCEAFDFSKIIQNFLAIL